MWPKSFSNSSFSVFPESFFVVVVAVLKVSGVQHYHLTFVQAFLVLLRFTGIFFFNYKLEVCGIPTQSKSLVPFL